MEVTGSHGGVAHLWQTMSVLVYACPSVSYQPVGSGPLAHPQLPCLMNNPGGLAPPSEALMLSNRI